jgi:hypothetical protein
VNVSVGNDYTLFEINSTLRSDNHYLF